MRRLGWASAGLVGVLALAWAIADVAAGAHLRKELHRYREASMPLRAADFPSRPPTPSRKNAALYYQRAFALLDTRVVSEKMALLGPELDRVLEQGEWREDLERKLADEDLRTLLRFMREGAIHSRFDLSHDYSLGFDLKLPHLNHVRGLNRLALAETVRLYRAGEESEALEMFAACLAMAGHVSQEPILVSQLTAVAQFQHAIKTIERGLLPAAFLAEHDSQRWIESLTPPAGDGFLAAWQWERAYGIGPIFRALLGEGRSASLDSMADQIAPLKAPRPLLLLGRPLVKADFAHYLRFSREVEIALARPLLPPGISLEREIPRYAVFTSVLAPAVSSLIDVLTVTTARRHLAATAIALEQFRLGHGEYPEGLSSLEDGALPFISDPFSGNSLAYRRWEDGFLLYSIGIDRLDGGGIPGKNDRSDSGDIVWQGAAAGGQ